MTKPNVIEMHDITKKFGEFVANDHINLDVRPGEIHALLGENGAGKSTLMNMLAGLLQPTSGTIKVNGQAVTIDSPSKATKLGILITVVVLSILFYRPFCKWICPLGAIYSLFNKVSFLHITIENSKCVGCNQCSRACKMDIDVCRTPNHPECIRCGACIKACPRDAIHYQFLGKTCQKKDTGDQQSEIRNH